MRPRSIIGRPLTLRQRVFDRDRGVCELCGLRTQALARWGFERSTWNDSARGRWSQNFRRWERRMIRLGRFLHHAPEQRVNLWDADHIHARADGGPDLLSNLRTVCWWCHDRRSIGQNEQRRELVRAV